VAHNPVKATDRLPVRNEHPRPLTPDEEARLFAAVPTHYHPWMMLALHTGLRLGELRAQRWEDVDLAGSTLEVTQPKSGKREVLPLNDVAFSVLAGLPQTSERVFPGIPVKLISLFCRYVRKATLPTDIHFHCLRDTYISRLAPHCTVPTLMALARHRNYQTTQRYLKIDDQRLRDVVQVLSIPAVRERC
jgi:integrase